MLACQKYKYDLPAAQAVAEPRHEFGIPADAFVNDNPFDVVRKSQLEVGHGSTLGNIVHRLRETNRGRDEKERERARRDGQERESRVAGDIPSRSAEHRYHKRL